MNDASTPSIYTLHKLTSLIELRATQVLLYDFGISFSHFKVLSVLREHDAVQQKTIADYLGQTEASISRLVVDLEKNGLVDRFRDVYNRRQNIVRLTTKGIALANDATDRVNELFEQPFSALSQQEQRDLFEFAERVLRKL